MTARAGHERQKHWKRGTPVVGQSNEDGFDAIGNWSQEEGWRYPWDRENRLVERHLVSRNVAEPPTCSWERPLTNGSIANFIRLETVLIILPLLGVLVSSHEPARLSRVRRFWCGAQFTEPVR